MLNDDSLSLPSSFAYAILKSPRCLARGTKGTLVEGEPEAARFSLPIPEEHHSLLSPARRLEQQPPAALRSQQLGRVRAAAARASAGPGPRGAAGRAAGAGRALPAVMGPLPAGRVVWASRGSPHFPGPFPRPPKPPGSASSPSAHGCVNPPVVLSRSVRPPRGKAFFPQRGIPPEEAAGGQCPFPGGPPSLPPHPGEHQGSQGMLQL